MISLKNGKIATCSSDEINIWDPTQNFILIQTVSGHSSSMHRLLIESYNEKILSCSSEDPENNYIKVHSIKVWIQKIIIFANKL